MKRFFNKLVYVFVFAAVFSPVLARAEDSALSALEKTPLPEIHVPDIDRVTLGNGLQLLMLEDKELPVVRGYLYLRTGGIYDPADKLGLATMTGDVWRVTGLDDKLADVRWRRFASGLHQPLGRTEKVGFSQDCQVTRSVLCIPRQQGIAFFIG